MVDCGLVSSGGVSEWFKEPVLKTGDPRKGTVGSNPTPSARILILNNFVLILGAAGVGAQSQILFGQEMEATIAIILAFCLILYFHR